jgi:ABC-type polysaccharide/polyol phosphate export permease
MSAGNGTARNHDLPGHDEWVVNTAPTGRWQKLHLRQIWTNRELIYFFALRDLRVRYKQAFLGVAWAGIQPLMGAITFTILFNRLGTVEISGPSYFAFAMVGFAVWTYVSASLTAGAGSLLANSALITKVALPRIVPPTAALLPALLDLGVALVLATGVALAAGGGLGSWGTLICLPAGLLLLILAVSGPAYFLSAVVVKYRDAMALVSFGLLFLLFVSPIAYPPEFVPTEWRTLLYLNPIAGALGLLRFALVDTDLPPLTSLLLSGGVATTGFLLGLLHFRRSEREFADVI